MKDKEYKQRITDFFIECKEYRDLYNENQIIKSRLDEMYVLHNIKLPSQYNKKCTSCIREVYYNLKNYFEKHI